MSEQIYTFRDTSFNINQTYYYTLLIQIDNGSFSYAIIYKKQLIAWDTNCNLAELSNPQELADVLNATYKNVVVGLSSTGFTLIPSQLFVKEQVANYARLLDVKPEDKVFAQAIDKKNFMIYKVEGPIVDAVQRFDLNNTVYIHKGWITAALQNNPGNHDVYVHLDGNNVAFVNFKNGGLRFYNTFEYKSEDDLTYFATFVTEELGILAHSAHLKLSGSIKPEDKYSARLADFFQHITFFNPQLLTLPEQIGSQHVLTLAALSLCGSSEEV